MLSSLDNIFRPSPQRGGKVLWKLLPPGVTAVAASILVLLPRGPPAPCIGEKQRCGKPQRPLHRICHVGHSCPPKQRLTFPFLKGYQRRNGRGGKRKKSRGRKRRRRKGGTRRRNTVMECGLHSPSSCCPICCRNPLQKTFADPWCG